ncbi:MAG TPA: response regulator [Thermoanaerobaculia bacterium]|nr:response regulator [Thermoanaerobaculia bacterium]
MPKKILLADDSITIQKVVELTFSDGDYEVSAVNNGAKAIQKLAEMRPDIILSDIIMPEKNGYEVCEYVKSHPEYRNIPVVLLTGTFEPFDPDRADKAGCDAVVTKPFESQSLIQKVEELISQAASAPAAPPAAEPVPEPAAFAADTSPWAEAEPEPMPAPEAEPAFPMHDADIFSAPPQHEPTMETPFDSGAFGGETRAFPRMSFEELQQMSATPEPEPIPEPPAAPPEPEPMMTGGETRAFPRMSFEELQQMAATPEPEPEASPFGAMEPAAEDRGTQAFPPLSLDESEAAPEPFAAPEPPPITPEPPAAAAEVSPWDQPPAFGGETRAFPKMSFEELQQMAATPEPMPEPPAPPPVPEPSPWDEQPMTGGETRAFPSMSFEELQAMSSTNAPAEEMSPWAEPEPAPVAEPPAAAAEASPFAEPEPEPEPLVAAEPEPEPSAAAAEPMPLAQMETPFEPEMTTAAVPDAVKKMPDEGFPIPVNSQLTDNVVPASPGDLTDEQIDRIARRVVQLMSEQVVRNIAWEVIPDMAEMVVKERIRQLESEA